MNIANEIGKQLNFIISSSRLYDEGRVEEALRIAVAARVLFHNTKHSKAIIGGHFAANGLNLLSTTMFKPDGPLKQSNFLGFIGLHPSFGTFKPFINDGTRRENIEWQKWWSVEPIMALSKNREIVTRRQLVLACANKDGGAHVDELKPYEYERLENGLNLEMMVMINGKNLTEKVKLRYANLAALRQIGHEILSSEELSSLAKTT